MKKLKAAAAAAAIAILSGAGTAGAEGQILAEPTTKVAWIVLESDSYELIEVTRNTAGRTVVAARSSEAAASPVTIIARCDAEGSRQRVERQVRIHLPEAAGSRVTPKRDTGGWIAAHVFTGGMTSEAVDISVDGRAIGEGRLRTPTAARLDGTSHPIVETGTLGIIVAATGGRPFTVRGGNHQGRWKASFTPPELDATTAAETLARCSRLPAEGKTQ